MADIYHHPGNDRAIDELYVFMSIDAEGRHGVLATVMPGLGSTPLITGSPTTAETMKAVARRINHNTGARVAMFKFTRAPDPVWEPT